MKNKVDIFTVNRKTKAPEKRVNHNKQMFMMIGLLGLVIAIPLLVFTLLQPEGAFETRREAAESTQFYGLLKLTSEIPLQMIPEGFIGDDYYYFAKTDKKPVNFGTSELSPKYLVAAKTNIDDLLLNAHYDTLSSSQTYSIQNVTTTPITGSATTQLIVTDEGSLIEEISNQIPGVSAVGTLPTEVKAGQPFSLNYRIEDQNSAKGDLIQKYSVTRGYKGGGFVSDDNWDVTTTPNYQTTFNVTSPLSVTIGGTPPESAIGKTLELGVAGVELIGSYGEKKIEVAIKENAAPEIQDIVYYENNGINPNSVEHVYRLIYGTKDSVSGKVEVLASDSDDTNLTYTFGTLPTRFKNVRTENNAILFDISWDNFDGTEVFETEVTVTDGYKSVNKKIPIAVSKKYTLHDPALCPPVPGVVCEDWSADFNYTVKTNSYQVTFTRPDNLIPSNNSIETFWWIFDDGLETYGDETVTHTYPRSGSYDVTLVIMDSSETGVFMTKSITVNPIGNLKPPQASFIAIPQVGNAPLTVRVNPEGSSDADGTITKYEWNFGDGQSQEHNSAIAFEHTFNTAGLYTITLTVTDNDGLTAQQTSKITVGSNTAPVVFITKPNQGTYGGTASNPGNRITWSVADAENNSPLLYNLYLVKSQAGGTCTSEATNTAPNYLLSSGNINYSAGQYLPSVFEWDTSTSRSGSIVDGYYCVKINVIDDTYGQLSADYSDNPIEIINAQHTPYVTTEYLPDAVKDQYYSTQVNAYDEDGDSLTFALGKGPNWVEVTNAGEIKGTPNASGPQTIIITVTDGRTRTIKVYTLNVKAIEGQILPAVTVATNIEVFVGSTGIINWTMENGDDVSSLDLQYSTDGENWNNIASGLSKDINEYNWDVSELEAGVYQIRILYYDSEDNTLGASSVKEIEIAQPEAQNESEPIVYGMKPTDGEKVTDKTPKISANFKAGFGSKVMLESVRVYLDNKQIQNNDGFEVFDGGFAYIVPEELSVGEHTVKAGFLEESGKTAEAKWYFEVIDDSAVTTEEPEDKGFSIYAIAIIVIIALSVITVAAYFIVKYIAEPKTAKTAFVRRGPITPSPFEAPTEDKAEEKVFRTARATLERDHKLNINQHDALQKLKEVEIVRKEKGEQNITKGY